MAEWAFVENNTVVECHDYLPNNWRNHSGLHLSENNEEFLNSIGWFKITKSSLNVNPNLEQLMGFNYQIENGQVNEIPIIQPFTETEIEQKRQNEFSLFLSQVRQTRNEKLKESDYTQLNDVISTMDSETISKWNQYRQQLRDFPSSFTEPAGFINWPLKPDQTFNEVSSSNNSIIPPNVS